MLLALLQERTSVAERTLGANQARLDRLQAETDGVKHELQAALVRRLALRNVYKCINRLIGYIFRVLIHVRV